MGGLRSPSQGECLPQLSFGGESSEYHPHSPPTVLGGRSVVEPSPPPEPSTAASKSRLSTHLGATRDLINQTLEVAEYEENVQKSISSHKHIINSRKT